MPLISFAPRRGCSRLLLALAITSFTHAVASAQRARDVDSMSVAPGVRVRGALVGASRAVVDSNDARRAAALTFSELMQARAASVNVMMSGGRLVDGGQFFVRGPSTLASEGAPMLIVDGIRMAEEEDDLVSTSSRLDDIAIDDIAKVEVLRGPSAAALYGAGASAGVIVVTTKQGVTSRLHGHVRATAESGREAGGFGERVRRRSTGTSSNFSCSLSLQASGYCTPGQLERWNPFTDSDVFRSGIGAAAAFDVVGGTPTSIARLSATLRRANGISRGDALANVATRLNLTQHVGDRIDVVGHVAYTNDQTHGSAIGEVIDGAPIYSVGPAPVDSFARWADVKLDAPPIDGRLDHLTVGGELTARPAHWLTFRAAATSDNVDEGAARIIPGLTLGSTDPNNLYLQPALGDASVAAEVLRRSSNSTRRAIRATGELDLPLPTSLRSRALLVLGAERERRYGYREAADGFGSGAGIKVTETRVFTNPAQFVLGRIEIADRVAIAAGARRENDSGADPEWKVYPVADVAIRPATRLAGGDTRLRAAYGQSAQHYAQFSRVYPFDVPPAIYYGELPPSRPVPETMRELEGGADVAWGSAGALSVTYYHRTVTNAAYDLAAPFGASLIRSLAFTSRGFELDGRVRVVQRGAVEWSVRGIVATNSNRVTSEDVAASQDGAALVTGFPIGVVQRRRYSAVDANGDGVFESTELSFGSEMEHVGGSTPTLTLALHSELRLGRRMTLSGVLDRRSGAWTTSGNAGRRCIQPELSCAEFQDQSTPFAEQARAWVDTYATPFAGPAYDATFTRLRELSLRWVPSASADAPAYRATVVISGRNLFTWTQWPGTDPEINSLGRGSFTRNDLSAAPLPRRLTVGVEMGY